LLAVTDLSVFYHDLQALRSASLTVAEGEMVSVVGSNAAGKSTLLNAISGIVPSTSGSIVFQGERIDQLGSDQIVARGIVQIPEGRKIFYPMTVLENLLLGSYLPGAKRLRRQNLDRVFAMFPILEQRGNQLAGTLSGGEQQMLAIGRGIMSNPKLLMLDEPSLGLAPLIVNQIFDIMREINVGGVTILLVEQNVMQSLSLAHRAYVLENGTITLEGPGKELLIDPRVQAAYLSM
jgi:branched-chain amino acid transport system ATP-binding protein